MIASGWQRTVAVLSIACFLTTSCTSLKAVSIPAAESPPALPAVKVGDKVEVTTRAGKKQRFVVTAVEADALAGKDERVAYADMATLNVVHIRKGATTAVVLVAAFVVVSIVSVVELGHEIEDDFNR